MRSTQSTTRAVEFTRSAVNHSRKDTALSGRILMPGSSAGSGSSHVVIAPVSSPPSTVPTDTSPHSITQISASQTTSAGGTGLPNGLGTNPFTRHPPARPRCTAGGP